MTSAGNQVQKNNRWKMVWPPAVACLLTAILLCFVFAGYGLYPFGANTLAWGDMEQQVIPLMLDFKDILAGKGDIFLNLQNAGGMSFWGVFFFFLSSPFTFLVALVEKTQIYDLVNLLVLLKISLSAMTASLFFRYARPGLHKGMHVFLCISYALSGFGLLYYQNLVWLDIMLIFPLTMWGFLKLVREGKSGLFCLMLALTVVLNYYLSYMVFLAVILIAGIYLLFCLRREERRKASMRVGFSAVLALGVTAPVWLPSFLQCLHSARLNGIVESIQEGGLLAQTGTTIWVVLFTAAAAAVPLLFIFYHREREQKALFLLFVLMVIPLLIEPINKMWHTGSYQAFPARYGYIPLLLGLWYLSSLFCEPESEELAELRPRRQWLPIVVAGSLLLVLSLLAAYLLQMRFDQLASYVYTLWFDERSVLYFAIFSALAAVSLFYFCFLFHQKNVGKRAMSVCFILLALIQGGFNYAVLAGGAARSTEQNRQILSLESELPQEGFYRVRSGDKDIYENMIGALGANSLSHYTSLTDERMLALIKKMGYSSYWMVISSFGGTETADIIFSNQYTIVRDESKQFAVQRTKAQHGIGFIVGWENLPEELPLENRFEIQNKLYTAFTGDSEAYRSYEPKQEGEELVYRISVKERETLYFDAFDEISARLVEKTYGSTEIAVNGRRISLSYPNQMTNGVLNLGTFEREEVEVRVKRTREVECRSFGVYGIPDEKVDTLNRLIQSASLEPSGNQIQGTVETEKDGQALFLSIPYYEGMEAKVNGKKVEIKTVLDCLIQIPLEQGENQVELSYIPQGMKSALVISALTLLAFATVFFLRKRGRAAAMLGFCERISFHLLLGALGAVLLAVYVLPLVILIL